MAYFLYHPVYYYFPN